MPRVNRREIVADGEIQVFHVVNRCVRRTHLCGRDRQSRKDYSHRRDWIRQRLEFLAGVFAVDILGFAVMSNHLHVVVRTRPDVVTPWSDDDVARRWWNLFPKRKNKDKSPAEPTEEELAKINNSPSGMKEKRRRLSNLSWFMKCLCEPIAKEANREDKVRGHFWESRYKAQPLLDEMAIAACMAYVDLNPIRAGLAEAPETSEFTSAQERIKDRQEAQAHRTAEVQAVNTEHGLRAGWLAPVELEPKQKKAREKQTARRASNKGCLFMSLDQYLQLLDWTARQVRSDKRGAMPAELDPLFERLQTSCDLCVECVENFHKWFRSSVGRPKSMTNHADVQGHNRAISITSSRRVFV